MFLSDVTQIFRNMGWANRITMMRIGAVLPILLLIHFPNVYTCWIAMFLFVAAAVTDFLDGYIARHYFGKSAAWLQQRLYGYKVRGRVYTLSTDDRRKFDAALRDIAEQIRSFSIA